MPNIQVEETLQDFARIEHLLKALLVQNSYLFNLKKTEASILLDSLVNINSLTAVVYKKINNNTIKEVSQL